MPDDFQFDPVTHIYTLRGVRLPSVTQVLESVGVINYDFIPADQRQIYLDRGRRVHTMTHFDDQGDLDESTVDEGDRGYLEAWRKCKADTGWKFSQIEHRMYHGVYRYAGTLDRATTDGWLPDIKTGKTPWWVGIQLAAYGAMLSIGADLRHHVAVELHADGTYKLNGIPPSRKRANWETFLAALRVYHVKDRKDGAL